MAAAGVDEPISTLPATGALADVLAVLSPLLPDALASPLPLGKP